MHRPTQSMHVAYGLTLAGAMLMVGGVSLLRVRGWTTPLQGRKIMHLLTGPVFLLCWLLFPEEASSRWLAATIPFGVALYMLSNALGWVRNRGLIQTVSRSGVARELASGPFYYGLLHAAAAALFWTDSPIGICGIIVLCIGDGVADLVGRPYGRHKWFYNRAKSVEGSVAFFVATLTVLTPIAQLFVDLGFFAAVPLIHLALVVFVAALVESLPLGDFDNIAVFGSVVAVGHLLRW